MVVFVLVNLKGFDMRAVYLLLLVFSSSIYAEKFHVVVGLAKPPYVIQDTNSGYEIELVSEVLERMGKTPNFVFVPFGRTVRMLHSDRVDSIMTVNTNLINEQDLLSDTYIVYQNVVITRKSDNFRLSSLNELSNLSIAAFQNAHKILGTEYDAQVKASPTYVEVANQKNQTKMLFTNKVQALVMDINIFRALSPSVGGEEDYSDVDIHFVFPKSPYKMAFKNKSHIPSFNQSLALFKTTERFQALVDKYNLLQ